MNGSENKEENCGGSRSSTGGPKRPGPEPLEFTPFELQQAVEQLKLRDDKAHQAFKKSYQAFKAKVDDAVKLECGTNYQHLIESWLFSQFRLGGSPAKIAILFRRELLFDKPIK